MQPSTTIAVAAYLRTRHPNAADGARGLLGATVCVSRFFGTIDQSVQIVQIHLKIEFSTVIQRGVHKSVESVWYSRVGAKVVMDSNVDTTDTSASEVSFFFNASNGEFENF
jgi:hypothetical protein